MSIYEAIGMAWVIFSSAAMTIQLAYFALIGAANYFSYLKSLANKADLSLRATTESEAE